MEEKEKVLNQQDGWVWAFILKLATLLSICSACIIAFMHNARELGLVFLLLLLIFLAVEERLEPSLSQVKAPDEELATFFLLLSGWQGGRLLGWLLEQHRIFPEAMVVAVIMLFIFYVSWKVGKMFEKRRREAARLPPEAGGILL